MINSLNPTDFCILKQQECKTIYGRFLSNEIQCSLIKCHGTYENECGSNICSNNITECNKFIQINIKQNTLLAKNILNLMYSVKNIQEIKKIKLFTKQIEDCEDKIYQFE